MQHCKWTDSPNRRGYYSCTHDGCRKQTKRPEDKEPCAIQPDRPAPPTPSMFRRVVNLTSASIMHAYKGFQTCSEEEIQKRFAICSGGQDGEACTYYNGQICTHNNCGCRITNSGNLKFLHKLGWADQKCPIDKWGAVEPES